MDVLTFIGVLTLLFAAGGCPEDGPRRTNEDGMAGHDTSLHPDGSLPKDTGGRDAKVSDAKVSDAASSPDGIAPLSSFSFLVYGDSRAGGSSCTGNSIHIGLVAKMAAEPKVSFVAHMGDMVTGYGKGTCFAANGDCTGTDDYGDLSKIIAPLTSKTPAKGMPAFFIPVIGNHEQGSGWYPDPCGTKICDVFDLKALVNHPTPNNDPCGKDYPSRAYYSFKLGSVIFFVLHANSDSFNFFTCNNYPSGWSSCDDYCRNGPHDARRADRCWRVHQYDWLLDGLKAADADPTITHKVFFLHAPTYTSFEDHPAFASAPLIAELADTYHVSLVFNGHNHCYERTKALRAGVADPKGTVYVTTSGGGVSTYDAKGDWFTAAHSSKHHYMRVDVDKTGFSVSAIGTDGKAFDTFHVP